MASDRTMTLKITGDARGLSQAFKHVSRDASKMERGLDGARRGLKTLGKTAAVAATAVVGAGAVIAKVGLQGAIEQEKLNARTQNVLKTIGEGAGRTTKQIEGLATQIERATGSDGQVVQAGANLVLTFGKIRNEAGKGNDVFDRTVRLANDMSTALGQDMQSSSIQLGKALNDPIKGVTALQRVGVSFTTQQKEQIKTLAESGRSLQAQKLILGEVEKQFGGAAAAEGPLTEAWQRMSNTFGEMAEELMVRFLPAIEQAANYIRTDVVPVVQRMAETIGPIISEVMGHVSDVIGDAAAWIRRNWEQISTTAQSVFTTVSEFIREAVKAAKPALRELGRVVQSTLELVMAIWDRWGEDVFRVVLRAFRAIMPIVRPALATLRSVIETVTALIEGDWGKAWDGIKSILRNAMKTMVAVIRGAGGLVLSAMKFVGGKALDGLKAIPGKMLEAGKAIVDKVVEGIKAAPGKIKDAIMSLVPSPADIASSFFGGGGNTTTNDFDFAGGSARGALLPGTYQGRDTMIGALAPGEAILTPRQQSLVESGVPIRAALAMTGGRIGGRAFAAGGIVSAAYQRAVNELGDPYGKPSLGQSRTGPNSWDCSGYATYVAQVNVGGTTASAYPSSSPSRGNELIKWGFRKSHSGGYRGGYDEHMGVYVNGRWFDAGSGGVESNADSARWQEVRVPRGLEGLTPEALDGATDTATATAGRGTTQPSLTPNQKFAQLLGAATGRAGLVGSGKSIAKWAKPLVNAIASDVPDVSAGLAGTSYTGVQSRSISSAARKARTAARTEGKSPEDVRAAGEEAERVEELKVLRKNRRAAIQARAKLQKAKGGLLKRWKQLTRKPAKGAKQVAARRKAVRSIKAKLREFTAEINDLTEIVAEINERIAELGEERIEAQHAANYEAGQGGDATPEEAAAAAPVEEPDLPTEQDFLNLAATEALFTETTDDDIKAARALERYFERQVATARAGGDPRQIAAALQSLLAIRQQIEALTRNTEAITDNTEALRGFGGSVTFGFRGQDYVLRNLAAPSSDRLENLGVGV